MTRDQAALIVRLHLEREALLKRFKALEEDYKAKRTMPARVLIGGEYLNVELEVAYVSAQWLRSLHALERRIREAGGTL